MATKHFDSQRASFLVLIRANREIGDCLFCFLGIAQEVSKLMLDFPLAELYY
jgi:hypothetical protein